MSDGRHPPVTEIEVPLGAIQFEGCAPLRHRIVHTIQRKVRRESIGAMTEPRSPFFSPKAVTESWRVAHECREMLTAAQRVESDVWHTSLLRQAVNASRRRFLNLRGAVRRIGGRSHRRAGRRATRGARSSPSEPGSSPEPPPGKLTLAISCGATAAGFLLGAALATVLP